MDCDRLLTTTRSVRKGLNLDAEVDRDVVNECLRIGLQAPNGSNQQSWRWLLVYDESRRHRLAELYREAYLEMVGGTLVADLLADEPELGPLMSSTEWLVQYLHQVPLLVIPCFTPYLPRSEGDESFQAATAYGSLFPAVWNFQLALRTRGYGTCVTTLHLRREEQVRELLGIPEGVVQGCLLPVARLRAPGPSKPAPRQPLEAVATLDDWTGPPA